MGFKTAKAATQQMNDAYRTQTVNHTAILITALVRNKTLFIGQRPALCFKTKYAFVYILQVINTKVNFKLCSGTVHTSCNANSLGRTLRQPIPWRGDAYIRCIPERRTTGISHFVI